MNIHEYQAKEILKGYGVKIQEGVVIDHISDVISAAEKKCWILKYIQIFCYNSNEMKEGKNE